jgi:hypothetical protein
MNKLYILGALALSSTNALWSGATAVTGATIATNTVYLGTYTYTLTGDCFSAGTATTNGMFNTYHQYYSFTLSVGTATFSPSSTIPYLSVYGFSGCYHQHLYNWMA